MIREEREDAIDIIQSILDKYEEDECLVTEITIGDEDIKAFKVAIKALEQESTTKENLGVDKEQLKTMIRGLTKWYVKRDNTEVGEPNTAVGLLYDDVMFGIDRLPSVTPQEPILDQISEIIEPLRHLPIGEMSDIEWDILRVIDKYKGENEE